ncbi:uncharacterized protein plekhg6 [Aulostomus maculatus]
MFPRRRTKQKVVSDFTSVSKGATAGTKPRAALRQVLFSQGASDKNPPTEEWAQLDGLKQSLGVFAVPISLKWKWREESQGTTLEKNWTDIVHSHSTMSKIQKHQQEVLWEFIHTELTYINRLFIIKDLVIAALVNLHQRGFLLEVTPELLFSNLPSILRAHQLFWQEVIYPMLQEVRTAGKPFDPMRLEAGCLQFHERFSSYKQYCWEEENNLEFARRQMETNPHFLTYIQWVETHPQCERMRLGDMQAKPHQRITKYPLLFKAVLKNTQDPHVQHTLRSMISSVNSFLESINDFLKVKDEQLALSISAQRLEGYEFEGINEEIDKQVREICHFDLTCPIRGVGPGVVRRLLLEENLKIRGRKDSKLEVVALLFSDVLLMTKVQKKGERLRVVRPPLALDRTYCMPLKDGCSFVLVEVGELRCAMNVYIFATSTSEICTKWVSTIHQAKETLRNLRETESKRLFENWKTKQLEEKAASDNKTDDIEIQKQSLMPFTDELVGELIVPPLRNGVSVPREAEEPYQYPDDVATKDSELPLWQSQSNNNLKILVHKRLTRQAPAVQDYEWIEMRRRQGGSHTQREINQSLMTKQHKVTWNNRTQSAPNLEGDYISANAANQFQHTTRKQSLIPGGYPAVDYPTDIVNSEHLPNQAAVFRVGPEDLRLPEEGGTSTSNDTNSQSTNQCSRRNSISTKSEDTGTFPETWSFSKNLRSPGLRRRRQFPTHQAPSTQIPRLVQGSEPVWSASNISSSNHDSDCNTNTKTDSVSSGQSSDSLRVLKLGALKPNQGMFWNMNDSQSWSEPELHHLNIPSKKPRMKIHDSASIPSIIIQDDGKKRSLSEFPQAGDRSFPVSGPHPNGHPPSPLEGLLERAKGRVRGREVLKRDRNVKMASSVAQNLSSSTTLSPSLNDGDSEWEEEVELLRHRALSVSKGWREQLVDGDDDDKRNSVIFSNGVNVDWPGWCFDDDEVMDHLQPGGEGLLEGISQSLTFLDLHNLAEQEDGEYSQV